MAVMNDTSHEEQSLQGHTPPLDTWADRVAAVEQAFDYRGDVTIHTTGGREVAGYVFDRQTSPEGAYLRVMLSDSGERVVVPYDQIDSLVFSGKDTAAGKSWEAWVRRYAEQKANSQSQHYPGQSSDTDDEPMNQ